jgi:uncharacterized protein YacL
MTIVSHHRPRGLHPDDGRDRLGFVVDSGEALASQTWLALAIGLSIGVLVICADLLSPARRKLALLAGTFFGLIVGVIAGYALSFIVALLVQQLTSNSTLSGSQIESLTTYIQLLVYCTSTYFAISLVLQTKDDFRFIVPFVEFRKQTRGARPMLLDTSTLIDGRVAAVAESGVFESQLIVPGFVIQELQAVADQPDRQKRNRGRRGLDVMASCRSRRRSTSSPTKPAAGTSTCRSTSGSCSWRRNSRPA